MSPNGLVTHLSRRQITFVEALLAGANLTVAAKTAGVAYSTAKRWQHSPNVRQALKESEHVLFEAALDDLLLLVPEALETLQRHLASSVEPTASTQLQAAKVLIEHAMNVHKIDEIEQGLAELREALDAQKH